MPPKYAFCMIYKSKAEYIDKQSVNRSLFAKLINKGVYDFESKRSRQVIIRFKNKVNLSG